MPGWLVCIVGQVSSRCYVQVHARLPPGTIFGPTYANVSRVLQIKRVGGHAAKVAADYEARRADIARWAAEVRELLILL
jgi:hypothetical protein